MFILKKTVGLFCMPLSMAGLALIAGLVLLCLTKRHTPAKGLLLIGTLLALGFASPPVADRLLSPLERGHPPLMDVQAMPQLRHVVVLGGGHRSDPRLPVTTQLSDASLARLVEGLRLHSQLTEAVVVFTGGAVFDPLPHARIMAKAARDLGLAERAMIILDQPRDTAEEMLALREAIDTQADFLLVTSASHMPRALALAKDAGLSPVPAPADFLVKQADGTNHPGNYFPSAAALRRSERAVYEYLGLIWAYFWEQPRLRQAVSAEQAMHQASP